jgi:hypothetical protein
MSGKLFDVRNNYRVGGFPCCATNAFTAPYPGAGNLSLKRSQYKFFFFQ